MPNSCQAIIWTSVSLLSIEPLETTKIQPFSFKKTNLKILFAKWQPLYLCLSGLNVLSKDLTASVCLFLIQFVYLFVFQATTSAKINTSHPDPAVYPPVHHSPRMLEDEINQQREALETKHQKHKLEVEKKLVEEEKYRLKTERQQLEKEHHRMRAEKMKLMSHQEQQELQWATIQQQIQQIEEEKEQIRKERLK